MSPPAVASIFLSSSGKLEAARHVGRAHPDDEQRGEPEVHAGDDEALPRSHLVVPLELGMAARLPAPPELERAEDDDERQDRARVVDLEHDEGAEEGDEERRRSWDALTAQLEHVAHLVDEDQPDETEAEPPAAEERIRADRDDHRPGDREHLELEEDGAELDEERADRPDRRQD